MYVWQHTSPPIGGFCQQEVRFEATKRGHATWWDPGATSDIWCTSAFGPRGEIWANWDHWQKVAQHVQKPFTVRAPPCKTKPYPRVWLNTIRQSQHGRIKHFSKDLQQYLLLGYLELGTKRKVIENPERSRCKPYKQRSWEFTSDHVSEGKKQP